MRLESGRWVRVKGQEVQESLKQSGIDPDATGVVAYTFARDFKRWACVDVVDQEGYVRRLTLLETDLAPTNVPPRYGYDVWPFDYSDCWTGGMALWDVICEPAPGTVAYTRTTVWASSEEEALELTRKDFQERGIKQKPLRAVPTLPSCNPFPPTDNDLARQWAYGREGWKY